MTRFDRAASLEEKGATMADNPITHLSWGKMEIDLGGKTYRFKDCKIWPEQAVAWDWTLTGTDHEPGIQPADIEEILAQGINVLVLSLGMELKMQVCPETEDLLKSRGIEYHKANTKKAVALFNRFFTEGRRVGGIFHSTC